MKKIFGSALIVAGTAIGAGMLALPMTAFYLGFPLALLCLGLLGAYMYYNSLVGLEVTLKVPHASSMPLLMGKTFGPLARGVTTLILGLFFYGLLVAYVAGAASILKTLMAFYGVAHPLPQVPVEAILFTVLCGAPVVIHMRSLDYAMKVLFTIKTVVYGILLVGILPHVKLPSLMTGPYDLTKGLMLSLPIFFASFGFHGTIPSLTNYAHKHTPTLKRIFLAGTLCAFTFYTIWFVATLGVMPHAEIVQLLGGTSDAEVGPFIAALAAHTGYADLVPLSLIFSLFSVSTSFVGVSVGLYHMCFEHRPEASSQKGLTVFAVLITYGGPLLIAVLNPEIFIQGLRYAAAAAVVIFVLCPALVAHKLRGKGVSLYKAPGGSFGLITTVLIGALIVVLSLV